ncbi:MAG: xanthine dehydrogenase molybdenum-binding subunit XdhA, partial [Bilophila sp.]
GHPYSIYPDHGDVADRQLLTEHVRFHGDEVAIVVAKDQLTARKAAHLVKVTYKELPVMTTAETALRPDAPRIHPALRPDGNLLAEHVLTANGSLDASLAAADLVLSGTYTTPTMQHCHLENQTAYAYMDDTQRITIVSSTQIPHICRRVVGQALGLAWSRVRVIKPCIGGGFGNKQDVILEPMVAFLTTQLGGAPVSIELTREECMLATRVRHAFSMQAQVGVKKDGTLLGYGLDVLSNTGAYASHGHAIATAGGSKGCYAYPRATYRFSARTFYSNIPIGGACRGYGSPQVAFAIECIMEDAARALHMDSLEFRLLNAGRSGDLSPITGLPINTHGLVACLETGRERFSWYERKAACQAFNANARRTGNPLRQGIGVAAISYGTGTYPANPEPSSARLSLNQDGTVHLSTGATEIGQGADTAFAQMVAETLGIAFENIHVVSTQDTDVTPWDTGAYASRQTYTCGSALHEASTKLKHKILEHASLMTGHTPAALTIGATPAGDAVVFVRDPAKTVVLLRDLALDAYYNKDRGGQLTAEASVKVRHNPPSFGCCFTEIEVDMELCKITIRHTLNVHDAGRLINPALAKGQVQGGMGMGIGWALYEELLIDQQTGRVYNNNLLDYKFPTACDMPDLDCAFVETNEPSGAYGNKSLGEPPIISPAPALRNAVLDATGIAINDIPLTPKRLFVAFKAAGAC